MQLMPSAKQDKCKSISILNTSVYRQQSQLSTHTDNSLLLLGRLCSVRARRISLETGNAESPILQSQWPQGFSICDLFCAHVL